jgi:hypothetical protein
MEFDCGLCTNKGQLYNKRPCNTCTKNPRHSDYSNYTEPGAPAPQEAQTKRVCANCSLFNSCPAGQGQRSIGARSCDHFAPASSAGEVTE